MGQREVDPATLIRHPENWRTHPERQAAGLRAVLERVGMVQGMIVNRTTGHILDGHLRVDAAIGAGQALVPITEVELTEEEERLVLATFDPLGGMAGVDEEMLSELVGKLEKLELGEQIGDVIGALMERNGLGDDDEVSDEDLSGPAVAERGGGSTVRTFTFQVGAKEGALVDKCFGRLGEKYPKMEDGALFVQALLLALAETTC